MSNLNSKEFGRHYIEVQSQLDKLAELTAPDIVRHDPASGVQPNAATRQQRDGAWQTGLSRCVRLVATDNIPNERPLPATSAMIGFSFYLIQYLNPISYLGFVFHLEYLPTHFGQQYAQRFAQAGVPMNAMSFLLEHNEADVGHNLLMADYVENLLLNQRDVDDTIYAMQVTTVLFANVVEAAFRRVDEGETKDYGINQAEFSAQRVKQQRAA